MPRSSRPSSSSRQRRKRKDRQRILLGLAAIAVIGVLFAFLANGIGSPAPTPVSDKVQTYYDSNKTLAPEGPAKAAPVNVAFIGDSYLRYWDKSVSAELGWIPVSFGVGGTGYVNGVATGTSYGNRAQSVIDAAPAIVIVSGGRNDRQFSLDEVELGANSLFTELRRGLPDAQIIAINPWWDDDEIPPEVEAVAVVVEAAVMGAGGIYLDSGQPLQGNHELIAEDGVHPNDLGYAALAAALVDKLRVASATP